MDRTYYPALRGIFGDWAFYSCLMSLSDLASRVSIAEEIHSSKALSEMIQRQLENPRADQIAAYLKTNADRFFSSLVVAVYGGDPAWHELDRVTPESNDIDVKDISEKTIATLGFLSFTGSELLFALDGQHRLIGIRKAVKEDTSLGDDEISVIFVSHKRTEAGRIRTRRLFTTLNKTAKPVTKSEIIALDETDIVAIAVRELVETHRQFSDQRIYVKATPNLPVNDELHLTTIINLYDVLSILFTSVNGKKRMHQLLASRPDDSEIRNYVELGAQYFELLADAFPALRQYFHASKPGNVVREHRHMAGGHILFRPVGLTIFTQLVGELTKPLGLTQAAPQISAAVSEVSKLPTDLAAPPYSGVLWNSASSTVEVRRKSLIKDLLRHMLGDAMSTSVLNKLKARYAQALGIDVNAVELPTKLGD